MSARSETLHHPERTHDDSLEQLPTTSIVIEWENVVLAGNTRAERMLAELGRQLRDLEGRFVADPEVTLLYDPDEVEPEDVERATGTSLRWTESDPFTLEFVASPGLSYYEQKNRGAELVGGEILVFLDSDVIPEEGWLETLLAPFEDERVDVVAGHTYLDSETLYQRAGKYFWFFPSREEGPAVFLAAVVVGTVYYTLALVGEVVSLVAPGLVERLYH